MESKFSCSHLNQKPNEIIFWFLPDLYLIYFENYKVVSTLNVFQDNIWFFFLFASMKPNIFSSSSPQNFQVGCYPIFQSYKHIHVFKTKILFGNLFQFLDDWTKLKIPSEITLPVTEVLPTLLVSCPGFGLSQSIRNISTAIWDTSKWIISTIWN